VSSQYLSEIRLMGFNFAPRGWAFSNGQLMSIQQNTALFALIGTIYGGNGVQTFALPNLQGRVAMHQGDGFVLGQTIGEINHTLLQSEMPSHQHTMQAVTNAGDVQIPVPGVALGKAQTTTSAAVNIYGSANRNVNFDPSAVANTGGNQPHPNLQPYLVMTYCISLSGIFPSRT
jgi:microcystin-dependent protein